MFLEPRESDKVQLYTLGAGDAFEHNDETYIKWNDGVIRHAVSGSHLDAHPAMLVRPVRKKRTT